MSVSVIMSDSRFISNDHTSLHSICAYVSNLACNHFGYNFTYYNSYSITDNNNELYICNNPINGKPRHASWSKVVAAYEHLKTSGSEWVCSIDSNVYLLKQTPLLDLAKGDITFGSEPSGKIWSGFFILRNCDKSLDFLEEWYKLDNGFDTRRKWEQVNLESLIKKYDINIDYSKFFIDDVTNKESLSTVLHHASKVARRDNYDDFMISSIRKHYNLNDFNTDSVNVVSFNTDKFSTSSDYKDLF